MKMNDVKELNEIDNTEKTENSDKKFKDYWNQLLRRTNSKISPIIYEKRKIENIENGIYALIRVSNNNIAITGTKISENKDKIKKILETPGESIITKLNMKLVTIGNDKDNPGTYFVCGPTINDFGTFDKFEDAWKYFQTFRIPWDPKLLSQMKEKDGTYSSMIPTDVDPKKLNKGYEIDQYHKRQERIARAKGNVKTYFNKLYKQKEIREWDLPNSKLGLGQFFDTPEPSLRKKDK